MVTSKLTSKAQTTIPQSIRRALDLHPGDEIAYVVMPDGVVMLRRLDPSRGREDPFATFDEWGSAEDEAAYAGL